MLNGRNIVKLFNLLLVCFKTNKKKLKLKHFTKIIKIIFVKMTFNIT